jgi:hypothetical protein
LCNIGIDSNEIELTPCITVHHFHNWDHGYECWSGINVYEDGTYENEGGYIGTRRQFYIDFFEMIYFLNEYIKYNKIDEMIIAPFYRYYQFDNEKRENDIYIEIYKFFKKYNIRRGERSGIILPIEKNEKNIEMIIEGAFRGISNLCILFPSQKVLLAPNHHFGLSFFSHEILNEKKNIKLIIKKYPNLRIFEK